MILYGIKNCNTVKKAVDKLNQKGISFEFHDYKKMGISKVKLQEWSKELGWENLINRKGTTWRKLDENQKEDLKNENDALEIMLNHTSIIRRPIIEKEGKIIAIGYDENDFSKKF